MRKTLFALMVLSVLFLVACQPVAQPPVAPKGPEAAPSAPEAMPAAEPQPMPPEEVPPAPIENVPAPAEEGFDIEQACYGLLSADEFNSACGRTDQVVLTQKISEKTCWVNIADHKDNKLTAGFTVRDWQKPEEANREFDRGVTMRRTQGAVEGKDAGERSYHYQQLGRENMAWVHGRFLTDLAAMNSLCPADKLNDVAKKIDSRLG